MQEQRRRFKQLLTLKDRFAIWAGKTREQAAGLKPGAEKDNLTKRARRAEIAANIDEWANSPGLQPPK